MLKKRKKKGIRREQRKCFRMIKGFDNIDGVEQFTDATTGSGAALQAPGVHLDTTMIILPTALMMEGAICRARSGPAPQPQHSKLDATNSLKMRA